MLSLALEILISIIDMSLLKFVEYTKHVDHSQKGRRFSGRVMEVDHLSSLTKIIWCSLGLIWCSLGLNLPMELLRWKHMTLCPGGEIHVLSAEFSTITH